MNVTTPNVDTIICGDCLEEMKKLPDISRNSRREQAKIFCVEEILPDALDEIERLRADLEQAEICIQARLDVIDQQATLIKSLKKEIRRLKHESKVEQEFTNSYIKRLHDAEARIKELGSSLDEAEALTKKNAELMNGYLGRIKVLEKNCIYDPEDGKIFVPDAALKKQWDDVLGTKPRSWQITEERVEALKQAAHTCHEVTAFDIAKVLRAMLEEAERE